MKEIWKNIFEFKDYQISNYGNVRSLKFNKKRILKNDNSIKYLRIAFSNNQKNFYIHRLVAQTFIPNPQNKLCVNHKDGNKQNNKVDNLEWVSYSENHKHAYAMGLYDHNGENHPRHKISEIDVLTIHGLYLSGFKQLEISKMYGLHKNTISEIIQGNLWKKLIR